MGLQKYFQDFNDKIKMGYSNKSELAEKRDVIIKKLRSNSDLLAFENFNQGSYATSTGVAPLDRDYDIDIGLKFNVNTCEANAYELKKQVHKILENHTEYGAEIKEPCVRVIYKKKGEEAFHVDLAIYAYGDKEYGRSEMFLARGDENSTMEEKFWEPSGTQELIDTINNKYDDIARLNQYRRIIRYIKRWRDLRFIKGSNIKPPSVGLCLLAEELFESQDYNVFEKKLYANDLGALIDFVEKILNKFRIIGTSNGRDLYRISKKLTCEPKNDVFSKITDIHMSDIKDQLETFKSKLEKVEDELDIVKQCEMLRKIFGNDFPEADIKNEFKMQSDYLPPSSASGGELD